MTLVFLPQKPTYDLGKGVVQFVGRDRDKLVLCGVTTAALKDAAWLRRATVDQLLELYETHKVRINLIAAAKYRLHRYDENGVFLVRSADLNP